MANKHQVLKLVDKGLTAPEIAKKLKCSGGYVRETIQRSRDPFRARNQQRNYRARKAEQSQSAN